MIGVLGGVLILLLFSFVVFLFLVLLIVWLRRDVFRLGRRLVF